MYIAGELKSYSFGNRPYMFKHIKHKDTAHKNA